MHNIGDKYFKETTKKIIKDGYFDENPRPKYKDGRAAHTFSINHVLHKYDLSKNEFPFLTLRPIAWKNAVKEILWIYQDQTSSLDVLENKYNIHWWNDWESKDVPRTIGQRYGATINRYDLVNKLIKGLQEDPFGRRHIMSLWQETDLHETDGLAPCAFQTIWNVRKVYDSTATCFRYYLDMMLVQRSSDFATAGAINGIQYCALLMMVAKSCGYEPGVFSHMFANVQIYDRHLDIVKMMNKRKTIKCTPHLILDTDNKDFYKFTIDDFKLVDYPLDKIKKKNPQFKFELAI